MQWLVRRLLAKLGSRTILTIGATLFFIDLLIPDPLPFLDEILIAVATLLAARWSTSPVA